MIHMELQRERLQELIQEEREKRVTQGELIKNWRKEAKRLRDLADYSYDPYDPSYDMADIYEECANELEAMT